MTHSETIKLTERIEQVWHPSISGIHTVHSPQPSDWKVQITPGFTLHPTKDQGHPNAFHRLMQRMVFGFVWSKAK